MSELSPVRLVVYIARSSGRSDHVVRLVREMVTDHLGGRAEVRVIDVESEPEAAEAAGVLLCPTIEREIPQPSRRVVGVPTDARALADALLIINFAQE